LHEPGAAARNFRPVAFLYQLIRAAFAGIVSPSTKIKKVYGARPGFQLEVRAA
jgi:hypothetical protein